MVTHTNCYCHARRELADTEEEIIMVTHTNCYCHARSVANVVKSPIERCFATYELLIMEEIYREWLMLR